MSELNVPAVSSSRRKVLLIEPAAVAANVFSAFTGLPLLGPIYLGTILSRAGFDVRVINEDLLGRPIGFGDLDADFLLLTCLTPTVERGYELAALFKRRNPDGKVFMGGPHVSFLPEEALRYADHVVQGEGENVVLDLIRHGTDEPVLRGEQVRDVDALPIPDWNLLVNFDRLRIQPLMSSRGCPFRCNFCSVTAMFGHHYRAMAPERVLEEARRSRSTGIFFYDDNFSASKKRAHAIVDGLLDGRGGAVKWWTAQVRADVVRDEELLRKMARSNCSRVYVGLESINGKTLKELHKSQTVEDVRTAIRRFHEHGIQVHGMFMFGADTDDSEIVRATSEFVRTHKIDTVQYMVLTPFPGTELFKTLESSGRLLHRMWRYYDGMHVVFRPKELEPYSLQKLALESYSEFYSVLHALNDGLEVAVAATSGLAARLAGSAAKSLSAPSLKNALFKLVGRQILRRWLRGNHDYLRYLRELPSFPKATGGLASVSQDPH